MILQCAKNLSPGFMTVSDVYSKYAQSKMIELLKGLIHNCRRQNPTLDDLQILAVVLCVSFKVGDEEYLCKEGKGCLDFSKEVIELYSEETFSLILYCLTVEFIHVTYL
eukprot:TRINITY_DN6165_c0_g2_i2.p3 TRINITY_DN6165_c0_g2~~TRINITY_DN6165_c0_g2_i2.p3  ORF type:complete len:109 (-),score=19.66 TRINITY_DN6165_c0_g2_i2:94-420(-)